MTGTRSGIRLVAALAALAAGVGGWAQTQPARVTATGSRPATATASAPAVKVLQPKAFLDLAAKAKKTRDVYVKGAAIVHVGKDKPKQIEFEVWARPPAARQRVFAAFEEVRVTDGKYVYTLRKAANNRHEGRRRKLTPVNYYHALDRAAVICDAATGYADLIGSVRFDVDEPLPIFGKRYANLKWFRLAPASKPPHHLLVGTKNTQAAIDPKDGVIRILTAELADRKVRTRTTVMFKAVSHGKIDDENLKLPAVAAEAKWIDADSADGRAIAPPTHLIAPAKLKTRT